MFRRFAGKIPDGALNMFRCHPSVLTTLLEVAWQFRAKNSGLDLGHPGNRSNNTPLPDFWLDKLRESAQIQAPTGLAPFVNENGETVLWDHLIYAYMIENTRIYEIFRRVLLEFLHGEKLGVPTRMHSIGCVIPRSCFIVSRHLFQSPPSPATSALI
jgi:hypothetical protein